MNSAVETAGDIRPFHVDIPDQALEDSLTTTEEPSGRGAFAFFRPAGFLVDRVRPLLHPQAFPR
jgi:hypothetical protein